jgi:serine/arginine repetitive matrix protein 2
MPAEVASDHRLSYTGQVDDAGISPISRDNPSNSAAPEGLYLLRSSHPLSEGRITSGLQPPLSDNTRSSFYTTASSVSNMSNLSDFPAPPRNHMSLLSAFFNEANGWAPTDAGDAETPYSPQTNDHNRLTFGAGADVEDIVQELSNNPKPF